MLFLKNGWKKRRLSLYIIKESKNYAETLGFNAEGYSPNKNFRQINGRINIKTAREASMKNTTPMPKKLSNISHIPSPITSIIFSNTISIGNSFI